jgi:hypothetical protein
MTSSGTPRLPVPADTVTPGARQQPSGCRSIWPFRIRVAGGWPEAVRQPWGVLSFFLIILMDREGKQN